MTGYKIVSGHLLTASLIVGLGGCLVRNMGGESEPCSNKGTCRQGLVCINDVCVTPPGPIWVSIPAGTYQMGCSSNDDSCAANERPQHPVTVSAFELTETEITQQQYQDVISQNPSFHSGCPNCPVEQVTWQQAENFCAAIGGRLPSEAEWEYAARANTTTRYYCGSDVNCLADVAWYRDNSDTGSGRQTHPAGDKTANAFGLYDMLGNVWEWVEDCWHSGYANAPSTGSEWTGGLSEDCSYRVLRGGSWSYAAEYLRASYRGRLEVGNSNERVGLRCAR